MKLLLLGWMALAVAIGLTAWLLPGMEVSGGLGTIALIAAVFATVNVLLGTLLRLITKPLSMMTLGLFGLVVNALLLTFTDRLLDRLVVDGFGTALLAAFLISVFAAVVGFLIRPRRHADVVAR